MSLLCFSVSSSVLAHSGHGNEFKGGSQSAASTNAIKVDPATAKRMGLQTVTVTRQRLSIGIKTTGQLETLPTQKVEVTNPTGGRVIKLFVQPGDRVKAGQPVALFTSPELSQLRADALEKGTNAKGDIFKAQSDLELARRSYQQQLKLVEAEADQAQAEVKSAQERLKLAQERYEKDATLSQQGAIPRRQFMESETQLAEAKAAVVQSQSAVIKAKNRPEVVQAANDIERATSDLRVSERRLELSSVGYSTRLKQLNAGANTDGTLKITAPISGIIADQEITLGQSAQDAGGKLMTIVNNRGLLAAANVYEKDLAQIKKGQGVRVSVASLPKRVFSGRITVIEPGVQGETRVVPVKAEIDNLEGMLNPGMFAQIEILTGKATTMALMVPTMAIVEANGKKVVYVENGGSYEPVEVNLGQTAGDRVEVKGGIFEGDRIVVQGAPMLYAQSLKGDGQKEALPESPTQSNATGLSLNSVLPWAIAGGSGVAIVGAFFAGGAFTRHRIHKNAMAKAIENNDLSSTHLENDYTPLVPEFCSQEAESQADSHFQ
jgi:cobalt-zinc-cadmium efflux system membrane fusion protein